MTAFQKLEKLLLENGDIGIPVFEFDKWVLIDENDSDIAEGKTLEEAAENLYKGMNPPMTPAVESENNNYENETLKNELSACRMALIKWLDYVEELKEITRFLTK